MSFATWAIVVVKDGLTENTLQLTDGAATYSPEENVVMMGVLAREDNSSLSPRFTGEYKRTDEVEEVQLQPGDKLVFIVRGTLGLSNGMGGYIELEYE